MAFLRRHHCIVTALVIFVTISAISANSGREFIFAPMPYDYDGGDLTTIGVVLQAVTGEETKVLVAIPGRSFEDHIILTPESGPYNYPLPISLINRTANGIVNSTVLLTSDQDIHVTSYNLQQSSSDTFSVVPKKYLGEEYFIALMTSTTKSGVLIISALNKTAAIEIFLNSTVLFENKMYYNGDILRYTLAPFESIQLLPQYINITGSRIVANTSIGVTAGSTCAKVPQDVPYCDHLEEQLVPFTAWGRFYTARPFARRFSGYILQIVAGRDNTTVSYTGNTENMNMGDYITVDITSQEMVFISATKPISIMQYAKGKTSDDVTNSDPSMIRSIPNEQYVTATTFPVFEFSSATTDIETLYLEVTAECKYFLNISIFKDNQPLSLTWEEEYSLVILDGTHMCSRWVVVTEGRYSIKSQRVITAESQAIYPRFSAVVYGTGDGETYLYRAGSKDRALFTEDVSTSTSDDEMDTRYLQGLIDPHAVSIASSKIVANWTLMEDAVELFDRCIAYIEGDYWAKSMEISIVPPLTFSRLRPNTEFSFHINCSNSLGIHSQVDFEPLTTLNVVPAKPSILFLAVDGIGQFSFEVNVPSYDESNGQISCFEFIVVQLQNSSLTSFDSYDDAYRHVDDYNSTKNQIGTPFRAIVLRSIPANNTVSIGSLPEDQSECIMGAGPRDGKRRIRRGVVKTSTLNATNGPLNAGGYYTCFLRVYAPTGRDGEFYFVDGPAMKPVQLKDAVIGRNTHWSVIFMLIIITVLILLNIVTIIIVSFYIYKRKRSDRGNNTPASQSVHTKQTDQSDDPNRYNPLSGQSEDVYQNVDPVYEEDEYEMVTFKDDVKKASKI